MKFIPNKPALLINGNLVVADLHNGIEFELYRKGVTVSSQTGEKLERLKAIVLDTKPEKLIILGDLKHNVPVTSSQERVEVPHFLRELLELVPKVIITKGNHDGSIERLIPPGVEVVDELIEDNVGYFHGHKIPSAKLLEQELIICAHTHPSILLRDIRGNTQQAWIETTVKGSGTKARGSSSDPVRSFAKGETRVLVVPAFDDSTRGSAVNNTDPIGPFLKRMIDLDGADIYLLDGSYLGNLSELRP